MGGGPKNRLFARPGALLVDDRPLRIELPRPPPITMPLVENLWAGGDVVDPSDDEPQAGPARLFVGPPRAVAPAGVRAAGFSAQTAGREPDESAADETWESRLRWTGLDRSARTVAQDGDGRRVRERGERARASSDAPQAWTPVATPMRIVPVVPLPPPPPEPPPAAALENEFFEAPPSALPPRRPKSGNAIDPFARAPPTPFVPRTQRPGTDDRPIPAAAWAAVGVVLLIAAGGYVWSRVVPRVEHRHEAQAAVELARTEPPGTKPVAGDGLVELPPALPPVVVQQPVAPPLAPVASTPVAGAAETPLGRLRVTTDAEARVRIDGLGRGAVDKLDDYELPIGVHTIKLTSIRTGRTLTQTVRIDEGRWSWLEFTFR